MSFEITADEFDALVKYHQEAIQAAIESRNYDDERFHEGRIDALHRHADEKSRVRRGGGGAAASGVGV
jgi:hypothetical protein